MYSMNENEVKRKWLILTINLGTNFDFVILKNFCLKQTMKTFSLSSNQMTKNQRN